MSKLRIANWGHWALAAVIWAVLSLFVLYPLSFLVLESLQVVGQNRIGLDNYIAFFRDPFYLRAFGNTVLLSILVVLSTTVLGLPLAYFLARYQLRGRTVLTALTLLPIVLPAYAGAFALIIFLGRMGTVNLLLWRTWGVIKQPINFIYGLHGLVLLNTIHLLPFMVLSLLAGYSSIDPGLEEAAEVEGASALRRFLTVTLPLCTPSYLSGATLVFLWPFTDWVSPLMFGVTDYLPSTVYINIAYHFTDVQRKYMGIVAAVVSAAVCVMLFLLSRWFVERRRYTSLSKGTTLAGRIARPTALGRVGAYAYMFAIVSVVLLIPVVLGLSAFSRRWVLTPFPRYWTVDNFRVIFTETPRFVLNTLQFSGVALLMGIPFGLAVAYFIARTRTATKNAVDFLVTMMLAFPGIAIGVGYLLAFWQGIPIAHYWVVMPLALFVRRLPYFVRVAHSAYLQLDVSLEEASEVAGAGKLRTFQKITLPLLSKGVFVGSLMFFIMAFQEISTAIFLYRGGWETLPIAVYLYWHRGMEFGFSSAMAFFMIIVAFVCLLIASWIGGGILNVAWGGTGERRR